VFDNGAFIFPTGVDLQNYIDLLNNGSEIIELINSLNINKRDHLYKSTVFFDGLINFLKSGKIDMVRFAKNIEVKFDAIRTCSGVAAYKKMFKDIYNYRTKNARLV
jgi:hypothetical protein